MSYLSGSRFTISPTPFAILTPSASSVIFYDESTESANIKKINSTSLKLAGTGYCEASLVHGQSTQLGTAGWEEDSWAVGYMRGFLMNKGSSSGSGAFSRPNGDDLALSIGTEHSWSISGTSSFTVTSSDPAKSHATLIMIGG